jgi:hypothetical protein
MTELNKRGTDNAGNFVFMPYDAKAPVTETGLRTVKCLYKSSSGKNNVCALVAPLSVDEINEKWESLMPHFVEFLQGEQDKLVKSLHTSDSAVFSASQIDLQAVINKLSEERISGRLNKEVLETWFNSELADSLTVLFADKLGISEEPTQAEADKLDSFIAVYKSKFAGLASNMVTYQVEECDKLLVALDKCEVDTGSDLIAARITERLEKMKNPVDTTALFDL